MKLKLFAFLPLVCVVALTMGLTSCDDPSATSTTTTTTSDPGPSVESHTVTYYDGEEVLHTETVSDGDVAPNWEQQQSLIKNSLAGLVNLH